MTFTPLFLLVSLLTQAMAEPDKAADAAPPGGQAGPVSMEARIAELESRLAELERDRQELLAPDAQPVEEPGETAQETPDPGLPSQGESPVGERTSFGGPVEVQAGEVVTEAVAFGGPVYVRGTVLGDAVSFGGDVILSRGARVKGDAVSFGGKVKVKRGARVEGDKVAMSEEGVGAPAAALVGAGQLGSDWLRGLMRRLVMLLCVAGAGVLTLGLFPERVRNVAHALEHHPIRYGMAGLFISVAGVMGAVLLAITLLGSPVSVLIVLALCLAWFLGFVGLCQMVGDVAPLPSSWRGRLGAWLVGVLAIAAIGMVPYVGKVLLVASIFPAVGAAVATRFGFLDR